MGRILPLLYFFQNVQGMKPVPALLRILPMVVAAACSPLVGGILARRGPRPVILGGLALMAGAARPWRSCGRRRPTRVVLFGLVLIGIGNIAVITPVTEIVLGSVPAERSGSAAALNNAAMQVGGALGAATLTSVFFDAARADYAARLASTGLTLDTIREVTRAWREAVRDLGEHGSEGPARGHGAPVRGLLPRGLHGGSGARLRGRGARGRGLRGPGLEGAAPAVGHWLGT